MLKPKVEISKEGFLELFFSFNNQATSMTDAHGRAVAYCDEIGLPCRFQSFDGFRKNVLEKRRRV